MAQQKFRVNNAAGMWLRTEPVVSEATKKALLPKGQLMTKLAETDKPDWWQVSTTFQGTDLEGFSSKNLMVADAEVDTSAAGGSVSQLIAKTLTALSRIAPQARANYPYAIRQGETLFAQHGITTPQRMAHFLAQAMQETGSFTVLGKHELLSAAHATDIRRWPPHREDHADRGAESGAQRTRAR